MTATVGGGIAGARRNSGRRRNRGCAKTAVGGGIAKSAEAQKCRGAEPKRRRNAEANRHRSAEVQSRRGTVLSCRHGHRESCSRGAARCNLCAQMVGLDSDGGPLTPCRCRRPLKLNHNPVLKANIGAWNHEIFYLISVGSPNFE